MSTYQSAFDHLKFITGQDTLPSAHALRIFGYALDAYSAIAIESQGQWKRGDVGNGGAEITYIEAVAGESRYELDPLILKIDGVQVRVNGKWKGLTASDRREHRETPLDELYSAPGTPEVYDLDGSTVSIYPALPTTDQEGDPSIRILRTFAAIHPNDLEEAILIPDFHSEYLALHGARQLGFRTVSKGVVDLRQELVKWEGQNIDGRMVGGKIREYYANRDEDRPRVMRAKGNRTFMRRSF